MASLTLLLGLLLSTVTSSVFAQVPTSYLQDPSGLQNSTYPLDPTALQNGTYPPDATSLQFLCAPDPFADPKHDPCNVLGYLASNALNMVGCVVFLTIALVHSVQMLRYKTWWMSAMVIGLYAFVLGFATRFGLHAHPQSQGLFKAEYLLIVLSPCLFIASIYAVTGHLAVNVGAEKYMLVPARKVTIIFVISDIVTFVIQAVGGIIAVTQEDPDKKELGGHISLVGFILQLISFSFFVVMSARFLYLLFTRGSEVTRWKVALSEPWYKGWRALAIALAISCVGTEIRSIYRTIEFAQGFRGTLATSEATFYLLDVLPLFIAIVVYIPFWPGRILLPYLQLKQESIIPLEKTA